MPPSQRQASSTRAAQRLVIQELSHGCLSEREPTHRLIVNKGGDDLAFGINSDQVAEEVVKHGIINDDSGHNGWVQSERMEHNAQNVGSQVPSFASALHGTVKRPALVVQRLSAAAVMLRFTEQFLTVFAHDVAP